MMMWAGGVLGTALVGAAAPAWASKAAQGDELHSYRAVQRNAQEGGGNAMVRTPKGEGMGMEMRGASASRA